MSIDAEVIAEIDATQLPNRDRHHLRLLAHCLDSFRAMDTDGSGELPNADSRRRWCEQQPIVAEDPAFMRTLLVQLNQAAHQLAEVAERRKQRPLQLSISDLIADATDRLPSSPQPS